MALIGNRSMIYLIHMTEEELRQSKEAEEYIKKHKYLLIEKFASEKIYVPDVHPISLFMAGSPGAGKTEVSKRLIEEFENKPVRIDADEIRSMFSGYTGTNAHVFQAACTIGVHKLYDYVLKNKLNTILDGTFAYAKALENVDRSLSRNREVRIYYLYQDPLLAWEITKKREALEHRNVSKEVFIQAFFRAREHAEGAKEVFGDRVKLHLIIKNAKEETDEIIVNIKRVDQFLTIRYTTDMLNAQLI